MCKSTHILINIIAKRHVNAVFIINSQTNSFFFYKIIQMKNISLIQMYISSHNFAIIIWMKKNSSTQRGNPQLKRSLSLFVQLTCQMLNVDTVI